MGFVAFGKEQYAVSSDGSSWVLNERFNDVNFVCYAPPASVIYNPSLHQLALVGAHGITVIAEWMSNDKGGSGGGDILLQEKATC